MAPSGERGAPRAELGHGVGGEEEEEGEGRESPAGRTRAGGRAGVGGSLGRRLKPGLLGDRARRQTVLICVSRDRQRIGNEPQWALLRPSLVSEGRPL